MKQIKTKIKQANWKSKPPFRKKGEYWDIVTTVFYQDKDTFIDTNSKLLFQMICEHFFYKYKKDTLTLKLNYSFGAMFPEGYRLYVYNLIYKRLTGKKIKNDIFDIKDDEELHYRVMLEAHLEEHQKRILKIIEILNINFKKESKRLSRVLFNTKGKKEFYLSNKAYANNKKQGSKNDNL
ncbi:MAG: hypothetical protein U9N59_04180 [Campylobacterota bacterium]|nr:hypothetical protein [Campylobacterota bacterium]